jgi:ABC-type Fe3+-siderophore transport system permease subunit
MNEQRNFTRRGQQIAGLCIFAVCSAATVWVWYTAFFQGYFYIKASMIFPALAVVGLGSVLFPDYKTERIARGEDISEMEGIKLLTVRWWAILAIALVCSFANFIFLKSLG